MTSIGPWRRCARPMPSTTKMVWPFGCVCHAVRAPGVKWTLLAVKRDALIGTSTVSTYTSPVNHSPDPLTVLRLLFVTSMSIPHQPSATHCYIIRGEPLFARASFRDSLPLTVSHLPNYRFPPRACGWELTPAPGSPCLRRPPAPTLTFEDPAGNVCRSPPHIWGVRDGREERDRSGQPSESGRSPRVRRAGWPARGPGVPPRLRDAARP